MSKIIVNTEWMKKYIQLHYTKRKLIDSALKYIGTNTKPDLPNPLLKIYEELNQFNLKHNANFKKKIEVANETK